MAEVVGVVACVVFTFTAFFVFLKILGATMGNRVPAAVEIEGLDIPEMGMLGYPPDPTHKGTGIGAGIA